MLIMCVRHRYVAATFSVCPTNLYEHCGHAHFYLLKV